MHGTVSLLKKQAESLCQEYLPLLTKDGSLAEPSISKNIPPCNITWDKWIIGMYGIIRHMTTIK